MVRFKLKTFLLSLIGIVAIATSSAFAYFIFSDEVKSSQLIEDKIRVDNIEENYIFGREDYVGKDYTIYLFPSTLYLEIYQDYLDDPSNNVLPEEAFGYIEAVTHSDGSIKYEITDDSKKGYSGYSTYEEYVNPNEDYLDESEYTIATKTNWLGEVTDTLSVKSYEMVYDIMQTNVTSANGTNFGNAGYKY